MKTTAGFWQPSWADLRRATGCTRVSVLSQVPALDFARSFPQDMMHDLLRGPLENCLCRFLFAVISSGRMTLDAIRTRLRDFASRWMWRASAPQLPVFSLDNLKAGTLDGSANETLTLCLSLPTLFPEYFQHAERVDPLIRPYLGLCISGFKLLRICMRSAITEEDRMTVRYACTRPVPALMRASANLVVFNCAETRWRRSLVDVRTSSV